VRLAFLLGLRLNDLQALLLGIHVGTLRLAFWKCGTVQLGRLLLQPHIPLLILLLLAELVAELVAAEVAVQGDC
jgi:hypothetical protein